MRRPGEGRRSRWEAHSASVRSRPPKRCARLRRSRRSWQSRHVAHLLTFDISSRSQYPCKHSGVLSAFREHFVKLGLIEAEYSNFYGEALAIREDADYAVEIPIDFDMADAALRQARRFVERIKAYLVEKGFWDESPD